MDAKEILSKPNLLDRMVRFVDAYSLSTEKFSKIIHDIIPQFIQRVLDGDFIWKQGEDCIDGYLSYPANLWQLTPHLGVGSLKYLIWIKPGKNDRPNMAFIVFDDIRLARIMLGYDPITGSQLWLGIDIPDPKGLSGMKITPYQESGEGIISVRNEEEARRCNSDCHTYSCSEEYSFIAYPMEVWGWDHYDSNGRLSILSSVSLVLFRNEHVPFKYLSSNGQIIIPKTEHTPERVYDVDGLICSRRDDRFVINQHSWVTKDVLIHLLSWVISSGLSQTINISDNKWIRRNNYEQSFVTINFDPDSIAGLVVGSVMRSGYYQPFNLINRKVNYLPAQKVHLAFTVQTEHHHKETRWTGAKRVSFAQSRN